MKALFLGFALTVVLADIAMADETWNGTGIRYDQDRVEVGSYKVQVANTDVSSSERRSLITITLQNGDQITQNCISYTNGEQWSKSCADGRKGGGYYFNDGIATEYTEVGNQAFAVTIVFDGQDNMRILVTGLRNGDVAFFNTMVLSKQFN